MKIFLLIIVILAVFFLIIDIIDVNRFVKREYVIESDKIGKEYRLLLLADLHNRQFGKGNNKLLKAIDEINPDFICCAGDMIVARPGHSYSVAKELMDNLSDRTVYYGIGNHEYRWKIYGDEYGSLYDDYKDILEKRDISVLENDCACYNDEIDIHGIMIDRDYYKRFEKKSMSREYIQEKCGTFNADKMNILIAHNPEYFKNYAENGADLVLSGHVHGGIMRLPFLGGVISPRLSLFPGYTGGEYREGKSTMILSCGLGCHTLPIRIFNPGELSVIYLKPCSK